MTLTSLLNNFSSMELIIGDDITLDNDHNYYYKGDLITGAISTTQFMSQQWPELFKFDPKYIPEDKLLEARVVGNTIHKLIELGKFETFVYREIDASVPYYLDKENILSELRFWNTKYNVVGSIDQLALMYTNVSTGDYTKSHNVFYMEDFKVTSAKYLSKKKQYANYQTLIYMLCIKPLIDWIPSNNPATLERRLGFIAKDKDFKYEAYELKDNTKLIQEIERKLQERINE